jgi:hypothetical protein
MWLMDGEKGRNCGILSQVRRIWYALRGIALLQSCWAFCPTNVGGLVGGEAKSVVGGWDVRRTLHGRSIPTLLYVWRLIRCTRDLIGVGSALRFGCFRCKRTGCDG